MGLSIHYKGSFNKSASLSAMIEEVKDIAETYQWKCFEFETEFPEGALDKEEIDQRVYGILFVPPECEPVYLTFLSNGKMSSNINLEFWSNAVDEQAEYLYMLSTKTQYAGMQVHATIIQMLKYLTPKYLSHFELMDEGYYWETNDINLLAKTFKEYNDIMDAFADGLANTDTEQGESIENFIERVVAQIHKSRRTGEE